MKNGLKLVLCIAVPLIVGGLSSIFTAASIPTWYVTINKPSFNPPNYIFAPVWTTLYTLMGISLYIALSKAKDIDKNKLLGIFAIQLILNFFWSFIFFRSHALGYAFIEILMLWTSILTMIIMFYKSNKLAGYLNIPYLLWVSFASFLNYSIYQLN